MAIKPIFPSFEESEYCNAACEYALMEGKCVCQECKGLHHGRAAYFERQKSGIPLGEKVTLIQCGGKRAFVRSSEIMSEEFKQFLDIANPRELGELFSTKRRGEPSKWGLTVWPLQQLGILERKGLKR